MAERIAEIVFMVFLLGMAISDFKYKKIPNAILIPALVPGFVRLCLLVTPEQRNEDVTTAVVMSAFLLIIYVICKSREKTFGGGDVKLIPETIIGLGATVALAGVFTGLLLLLLANGIKIILKRNGGGVLPLGPWIALGCFIVYFPLTA